MHGLDPHQILIVRDLIAHLRGRMSVIISSHILPEIEATCDRVLIINAGRIVAQGSPADLRHEIFGQTNYRVELAGDLAKLPVLLTTVEPSLMVSSSDGAGEDGFATLTLAAESKQDLGEALLRALTTAGFRLRSLSRHQPSLEDVFLSATRRSWDARLPDNRPHTGETRAPLPKL